MTDPTTLTDAELDVLMARISECNALGWPDVVLGVAGLAALAFIYWRGC